MNERQSPGAADSLYTEATEFVVAEQCASISTVQRKFKIGYNRASNLIDAMEEMGVVTKPGHRGSRRVLAANPAGLIAGGAENADQAPAVEITSEEVRWRMEKVLQIVAATGTTAASAAKDFNRALHHLKAEVAVGPGD
jgi:hypothetical protein